MDSSKKLSLLVLQIDDRTLDPASPDFRPNGHWHFTIRFNASICKRHQWSYRFIPLRAPCGYASPWIKPFAILQYWKSFIDYDLVLYLDTDCWIRNPLELESILGAFACSNNHVLFSADAPGPHKINSGVFCFCPKEDFLRALLASAVNESTANTSFQIYRSERLFEQHVLNAILKRTSFDGVTITPRDQTALNGSIICHCWEKHRIRTLLQQDAERIEISY